MFSLTLLNNNHMLRKLTIYRTLSATFITLAVVSITFIDDQIQFCIWAISFLIIGRWCQYKAEHATIMIANDLYEHMDADGNDPFTYYADQANHFESNHLNY